MPASRTLFTYQPFLRASVRFLVVGCAVYFLSLFFDGAFGLKDLFRASIVFGVSGLIFYHWQHLLTVGIEVTDRALYHRSPLTGPVRLRLDRLEAATVQEEYTFFSDSKTILTLTTREVSVRLRISHLEDMDGFLEALARHLSPFLAELEYLEGDTGSTRSLREGI